MAERAQAPMPYQDLKARSLVTPEGVELRLRIADTGQRLAAFIIDMLVIFGAMTVLTLLLLLGAVAIGDAAFGAMFILWLTGQFILRNFYFILLELGPRAATFGKRRVGLRVVSRSGGRLTADAVIARNLMREIELFLPLSFLGYNASQGMADGLMALFGFAWTAIFLFFPFLNKDRLRVGDLLAGTWVIEAPRRQLGLDLVDTAPTRSFAFTDVQLDAYGVYELQTLESVLRLRDPDTMKTVAESISAKIGFTHDGADEAFLIAYYDALRARLERNLLLGRRRENKHDRG
jgi:uncharacterized RDD family membrane protein YckC